MPKARAFKWKFIDNCRMYGYEAIVENRKVEVVRTDTGSSQWATFYYRDGKMVVLGYAEPDTDLNTAKLRATTFLLTNQIPENAK